MIITLSESKKEFKQILRESQLLVLDIETLDSKASQLWNEPIISFSISLANRNTTWDVPTLCYTAESVDEEYDLLLKLQKILVSNQDKTIAGHNVSWEFKNRLPWKNGYDLPKIYKRGLINGLDFYFVKNLRVFDSMDEAFANYDHSCKPRYFNGLPQKVLRCEHIEEDFQILRPDWLPKLGPQVRAIFEDYVKTGDSSLLRTIHLYNACDSIVESIIMKIFTHYIEGTCDMSGRITAKNKCRHIPKGYLIDQNATWVKILEQNQINIPLLC